jgi:very-short-patch-repair endonuclease
LQSRIQTLGPNVKRLRRDQTDAERKLWMRLRDRQLNGLKFRRQQPIGRYVVDFCCPECRLVIELDGGHHASQVQKDQRRTEFLNKAGYRVLRFWDNEVLTEPEAVLQKIAHELNHPSPLPSPSRGEGEENSPLTLPSPSEGRGKKSPLTLALSLKGRGNHGGKR